MYDSGLTVSEIVRRLSKEHGIDTDSYAFQMHLYRHLNRSKVKSTAQRDENQYGTDAISTDKKLTSFSYKDIIPFIQGLQKISKQASFNQEKAAWRIKTDKPIVVATVADLQLGSWATDYDLFMRVTDEIINTPDLYVLLLGDILQMAIKLRGVLEVSDNIIPPKLQYYFLESWLQDIQYKVIASTWDNHSVMREEAQAGYSTYAAIFGRHTIYANGICHLDTIVNDITYKWAITHFFRGKSMYNKTHAPERYLRMEFPEGDIAAQGDFHEPGISKFWERQKEYVAIVTGSIQTNSGYAKRFFSLTTAPVYPCVVLQPDQKMATPYWSVKEYLANKR